MNNRTLSTIFILIESCLFLTHSASSQYLSGYGSELQGETIQYESQQPDATQALLVRSENSKKYIEWLTDTIPDSFEGDTARFILIAGIDVNPEDNHGFQLYLNDKMQFSFRNPLDTLQMNWQASSDDGVSIRLQGMMIDKYGDLFGYAFLAVPRQVFNPGEPIKIRVEGESSDSRSWFMVFKYSAVQQIKFIQESAILKQQGTEQQLVRVDILHFDEPALASIGIGKSKKTYPLTLGFNMFRVPIPRVKETTSLDAFVRINDQEVASEVLLIEPVEQKTIYLLPHSHTDIGYTHVQEEVEAIQWQNIRDAIRFSTETANYPPGAQFKWNGEVMWAVDSYLDACTEEEKQRFIEAVKNGWFELDALYANILTGLCRPEELFRMVERAHKVAGICGVNLQSAMISDIPGYTWSLVPALAQSGVRYFSIGTNTFHRIGDIIETWGDCPFYWQSPSGDEKVLCWVHGKGYSEFHTGLAYTKLRNKLKEQIIFDYVNDLAQNNYPYDLITMRYNIGSDNGPPDPFLSDIVKAWNEKYSSPRIVVSTVGEAFGLFERQYGDSLPVYRGDLTGYWEDGAASSARETAMNRASAEKLTQSSIFYSLFNPDAYPASTFDEAWKNILLYSEHTWGSWNSISEPHSPFTLQQWETKKSFAEKAAASADLLLTSSLPSSMAETVSQVDIYNSSSWERTDLVTIPANFYLRGERVRDESGRIIATQRLHSGELVFVAEKVPAHCSKRYFFEQKPQARQQEGETDEVFFPAKNFVLELSDSTGSIASLKIGSSGQELVDQQQFAGLNEYIYVSGRDPANSSGSSRATLKTSETGPVLTVLTLISQAPGCDSLVREYTLYDKLDYIDIKNTVYKQDILDQEGLHFAFPFQIPEGRIRISNAWGHYEPENEQLPGANRNFFSAARWVDLSGETNGITFVTQDAPLVEIGGITNDPIDYGWVKRVQPSQTILSYPMNNYWETNYKASQSGEAVFRYSIYPHGPYDPLQAEQWGIEKHQPLIPVVSDRFSGEQPVCDPAFVSNSIIVENIIPLKGVGLLYRLYNPGYQSEKIVFRDSGGEKMVYLCDPLGENRQPVEPEVTVAARAVMHVVVPFQEEDNDER